MRSIDGGPAFPVVESHPVMGTRVESGMTLRDYFAGQALAGLLANSSEMERAGAAYKGADKVTASLSYTAYKIADLMLKARAI